LLIQQALGFGLVVLNKLDDVTLNSKAPVVAQDSVVAVKLLHVGEICVAHTNNDDGTRQSREVHKEPLGLSHIMDGSISQQEQDIVDCRSNIFKTRDVAVELLQEWSKQCRTS
jgi:hypothetical protein